MESNKKQLWLILVIIMFSFSCQMKNKLEVTQFSVAVGPSNLKILEVTKDSIFCTNNKLFKDSVDHFEYARVSKVTEVEFDKIVKTIRRSGILSQERQDPGSHIGTAWLCVDFVYSDGSIKKYEKINLSRKEFILFDSLLDCPKLSKSLFVKYDFRLFDCVERRIPSEIQQPEEILVPEEGDSLK